MACSNFILQGSHWKGLSLKGYALLWLHLDRNTSILKAYFTTQVLKLIYTIVPSEFIQDTEYSIAKQKCLNVIITKPNRLWTSSLEPKPNIDQKITELIIAYESVLTTGNPSRRYWLPSQPSGCIHSNVVIEKQRRTGTHCALHMLHAELERKALVEEAKRIELSASTAMCNWIWT